jgi:hypothetical protein
MVSGPEELILVVLEEFQLYASKSVLPTLRPMVIRLLGPTFCHE